MIILAYRYIRNYASSHRIKGYDYFSSLLESSFRFIFRFGLGARSPLLLQWTGNFSYLFGKINKRKDCLI